MRKCQLGSIVYFVVFALAAAFAQTPPTDTGLVASPVYQKNCEKCHGKTAGGRHFGGPSLISAKTAGASAEDLHTMIANGKGHMPKFVGKLSAEEIDALVQQIQALNRKVDDGRKLSCSPALTFGEEYG